MISRQPIVTLLFALLALAGCQSELDRLDEANAPLVEERKKQAIVALASLDQTSTPGDAYEELIAVRKQITMLESTLEGQEGDLAAAIETNLSLAQSKEKEVAEQLGSISSEREIHFEASPQQNAMTVLLVPGEELNYTSDAFAERNPKPTQRLLLGFKPFGLEEAKPYYSLLQRLRYLLVLRQAEIALPEFTGKNDLGQPEFTLGAIRCHAYLLDLQENQMLASWSFIAPNQRGPASVMGIELFLPEDPEDAVSLFTTRLYDTAHDYAAATATELGENVTADYRIERPLYLEETLEHVE